MPGDMIAYFLSAGVWLLGVSFAAGVNVATTRQNKAALKKNNDDLMELQQCIRNTEKMLQDIQNDQKWIKRYLNLNGDGTRGRIDNEKERPNGSD